MFVVSSFLFIVWRYTNFQQHNNGPGGSMS